MRNVKNVRSDNAGKIYSQRRTTPQQHGLSRGAHFRLLDSTGYYRKNDYYLKKYGAVQYGAEVLKLSDPLPRGALLVLRGGGRVVCMRDVFILNEIRAQHKTHILVRTLFG
jgi:hypothetical protein